MGVKIFFQSLCVISLLPTQFFYVNYKVDAGDGMMAQRLRGFAALPNTQIQFPTPLLGLTTTYNSGSL